MLKALEAHDKRIPQELPPQFMDRMRLIAAKREADDLETARANAAAQYVWCLKA